MERFIGIDVGGTNIKCGLVDAFGNLDMKSSTKTASDQDEILEQMGEQVGVILRTSRNPDEIKGIGVAVPGSIDVEKGIAIGALNLPWRGLHITSLLSERFNLPVKLEKDTDAGALGEFLYGKGKGSRNFFYIGLGTGVGGGMIVEGRLYRGAGGAGEIGHIIVQSDGPMCKCGARGCLEAVASATAIVAEASKGAGIHYKNAAQVFAAAAEGDLSAKAVLEQAGLGLASAVITVHRLIAPDIVVIGGGVSKAGSSLLELVTSGIKRLSPSYGCCPVVLSETADWSGVLGAAAAGRVVL